MDNTEQSLRILGKFLAIASTAKVFTNIYVKEDIPKNHLEIIVQDLHMVLEEYNKIKVEDLKKDVSLIWCSSENEEY
ncbi:MAG: hypothetical protein AAB706_03175 [Patescibacteria group bacterium]